MQGVSGHSQGQNGVQHGRNGRAEPDSSTLDFISGHRGEAEFLRAKSHARKVRLLKIFMPVLGVVIMLGIGGSLLLSKLNTGPLDIGAIAFEDGKLVMENPNLNGVDKNKRPFSLSADRAVQDADQPKRVELVSIKARLPVEDADYVNVTAGNGVYDADLKTLVLSERILVEMTDGTRVEMEQADVDIKAGSLHTDNPITATSRQADISADRFSVEENGERVIFEGRVRMVLRPNQAQEAENRSE